MDNVFKEQYTVFIFSLLPRIKHDKRMGDYCKFEVDHLHELWNQASDMIDRAEFWLGFTSECCELNLPYEDYDIEEAFEKARKEWKEELMLQVADKNLKWYDDDIPPKAKVVTIVNGRIQVDTSICRLYASYDIED